MRKRKYKARKNIEQKINSIFSVRQSEAKNGKTYIDFVT